MKTIRMLSNEVGADGESLAKDSVYSLNDASADRWLRRGKAEEAELLVAAVDSDPAATAPAEQAVTPIAEPPHVAKKPGPKPKAAP